MTDAQLKALDECRRAVGTALIACARERNPDPAEQDLSDPTYRLCVEASRLVEVIGELRGKPTLTLRYA